METRESVGPSRKGNWGWGQECLRLQRAKYLGYGGIAERCLRTCQKSRAAIALSFIIEHISIKWQDEGLNFPRRLSAFI